MVSILGVWRYVTLEIGEGSEDTDNLGAEQKMSYRGEPEVNLSINVSFLISVNYAPVHFIPAWTEVPRFMNEGSAI